MFVTEDLTTAYAKNAGAPVVPCGCSQKTGTVRHAIRDIFAELEKDHPYLKQTMLTAMSNVTMSRLLDLRYLSLDPENEKTSGHADEGFSILDESDFTEL
jgi:tRNA 2-thiocytidine biosynthesis protein TtcA